MHDGIVEKFKKVNKNEFEIFIKEYSRELKSDVARMFEPPLVTYNDFILGAWPESIVAHNTGNEYYILKDAVRKENNHV